MSQSKIIDLSGRPMNGAKRKLNIIYSVPALPDDAAGLDRVAHEIEGHGVQTPSDAFTVASLRALAKALRRIEALEAKKDG